MAPSTERSASSACGGRPQGAAVLDELGHGSGSVAIVTPRVSRATDDGRVRRQVFARQELHVLPDRALVAPGSAGRRPGGR